MTIGMGTIVTSHGWLYDRHDSNGGLDKKLLIDNLMGRCDAGQKQVEYALGLAERCGLIGERNSKIYLVPRD